MCSIGDGDGDYSQVWIEKEVKARKEHLCDCCGGRVAPGEQYIRHFSVYDGQVTAEKCCLACDQMRDAFDEVHDAGGTPKYMPHLLHECIAEERRDGNDAMVQKWEGHLQAMAARREAANG